MTYYIEDYYTDDIVDVTTDLELALNIARSHPDAIVTDEHDNVYYINVELPF